MARKVGLVSICDFIQPDRLPPNERTAAYEVPPCGIIGLNTVQQSERNAAAYHARVAAIVRISRSVAASFPIIARLPSNPRGTALTANELVADMRSVAPLVQ